MWMRCSQSEKLTVGLWGVTTTWLWCNHPASLFVSALASRGTDTTWEHLACVLGRASTNQLAKSCHWQSVCFYICVCVENAMSCLKHSETQRESLISSLTGLGDADAQINQRGKDSVVTRPQGPPLTLSGVSSATGCCDMSQYSPEMKWIQRTSPSAVFMGLLLISGSSRCLVC